MTAVALALVLFLASALSAAEGEKYPRGELLVEPSVLAAGQFVVLDARSEKDYAAGHVPGARRLDAEAWAKAFGDGADAAGWSQRIGGLGVDATTKVVVYDDAGMKDAARVWWILRYWGLADVRLLNGGWKGWKAAGLPVSTEAVQPARAEFKAVAQSDRLATREQLLASLKDRSLQIVDARSEKEHCGLDKLKNQRGGAIPGAKNLEFTQLLDPQTGRFKTPAQLRRLFQEAGIDLNRPSAAHCQSGGRSSVMAFGMELMGAADVRNYYRSWSEWGNRDDTPIETPKAKP